MPRKLSLGTTAQTKAWFAQIEARKARVHPEHPAFVAGCTRCIEFRASLFTAN
jgi:hypothetical protein